MIVGVKSSLQSRGRTKRKGAVERLKVGEVIWQSSVGPPAAQFSQEPAGDRQAGLEESGKKKKLKRGMTEQTKK